MATFMGQRMSERYSQEVDDLREWFKERLPELGSLSLSRGDYNAGVDNLLHPHRALVNKANAEWLGNRQYKLSYNQMCQAFFAAANDLKLLTLIEQPST